MDHAVYMFKSSVTARTNIDTILVAEILAHSVTGASFWFVYALQLPMEALLSCGFAASLVFVSLASIFIDVDHFIAASNLSINSARSLQGRPFLHWSGALISFIVITAFLGTLAWCFKAMLNIFLLNIIECFLFSCFLFIIAWTIHLLRDAIGRGVWIWPPPNYRTLILSIPEECALITRPLPLLVTYPIASICLILLSIYLPLDAHTF